MGPKASFRMILREDVPGGADGNRPRVKAKKCHGLVTLFRNLTCILSSRGKVPSPGFHFMTSSSSIKPGPRFYLKSSYEPICEKHFHNANHHCWAPYPTIPGKQVGASSHEELIIQARHKGENRGIRRLPTCGGPEPPNQQLVMP